MLKNDSLVSQVLEIIDTLIEAAEYMYECAYLKKYSQLEITATDMINMLHNLYPVAKQIKNEFPFISTLAHCENLLHSINTILRFMRTRSERVCKKIEFELIPILQDFKYDFYFFTCVFGNPQQEKSHYAKEFALMTGNQYIDQSMETGEYKYDVSISVLAYNNLEYTKKCIESILKYTPNNLNYELVLIDNGSTDGTSEYFELLFPTKIFSLKNNSLNIMTGAVSRIYEGKYQLTISNDVIVTANYLENLIKCIESDSKIAMVVPTTPNTSNLQSISAQFSTLEEMYSFAEANNILNSKLWEERTRLCNPVTFCRSDVFFSSKGVSAIDKYFIYGEFGDDALALRLRRAGYKMILAKDCYCYHFGSVTLKEAQVRENTLEKSRKLFMQRYGVDAWSTGFCYDINLIESITLKLKGQVNILGINSGFGSNPLKIKTLHKEAGNEEVDLFFVTDDERYILDLQVYSHNVKHGTIDVFENMLFDCILLEGNAERIFATPDNFYRIKKKLLKGGTLAICATNDKENSILNNLNADLKIASHNCYWFLWKC